MAQPPLNDDDDTDGSIDQRLSKLKERLDGTGVKSKPTSKQATDAQNAETRKGVAQAFRLSSEFIAGVVVGTGIGYAIDQLFGTTPWGLIIGLFLGFGAAVLNVLRAAGMVSESELRLKQADELHKQQQDDETDQKREK